MILSYLIILVSAIALLSVIFISPEDFGIVARCVLASLAFGGILVGWGRVLELRRHQKLDVFFKNAEKVSGLITKVTEDIFNPHAGPYNAGKKVDIEFTYKDLNGREYTVQETHTQRLSDGFKVGHAIEVKYDKRNPAVAYSAIAFGQQIYDLYR